MKKIILFGTLSLSYSALCADLAEIFKQSEAHDPQLSAARHTLDASMEGKKQAFSAFLPTINSSIGRNFGKNKNKSFFSNQPATYSRSESWNVSLSQTLYNHANYQNYHIAELQILKSQADYTTSYQDFILRVAQSYFNLLAAKDSLVFSKAEEKAIQRQLDQAEQRFEVGLAAITDVHEARARYDSARASVILAQNVLDDSKEALFEMSQKYYQQFDIVPDDLDYSSFKLSPMEAYQKKAITQSPEFIAAKVAKDIAEKQIEVSRAGHYPTLALSFGRNHGVSKDNIFSQFNPQTGAVEQFNAGDSISDSNSVALSLNVPIYAGGRTQSQVRQSVHNHKAAMDRYEQARRGVIRKVRNAFHGTLAAKSSVEARKQAMISAQSGLEATQAGYEVGTRTIVDVLNSQRGLYQAQRDYSKAKYDYFIKYLSLKRAAGDLSEKDILTINKILQTHS